MLRSARQNDRKIKTLRQSSETLLNDSTINLKAAPKRQKASASSATSGSFNSYLQDKKYPIRSRTRVEDVDVCDENEKKKVNRSFNSSENKKKKIVKEYVPNLKAGSAETVSPKRSTPRGRHPTVTVQPVDGDPTTACTLLPTISAVSCHDEDAESTVHEHTPQSALSNFSSIKNKFASADEGSLEISDLEEYSFRSSRGAEGQNLSHICQTPKRIFADQDDDPRPEQHAISFYRDNQIVNSEQNEKTTASPCEIFSEDDASTLSEPQPANINLQNVFLGIICAVSLRIWYLVSSLSKDLEALKEGIGPQGKFAASGGASQISKSGTPIIWIFTALQKILMLIPWIILRVLIPVVKAIFRTLLVYAFRFVFFGAICFLLISYFFRRLRDGNKSVLSIIMKSLHF